MKTPELGPWLQRFFREHLLAHRNLSPATIAAYRDTFRLLLRYLKKGRSGSCFSLPLDVLDNRTHLPLALSRPQPDRSRSSVTVLLPKSTSIR